MNSNAYAFDAGLGMDAWAKGAELPFDRIAQHSAALVVPFDRRQRSGRAFRAGVFGADGQALPDTALRTLGRWAEPDPQVAADMRAHAVPLEGSWLFGGIVSAQFGHIITRSLGTLWATQELPTDVNLLFVSLLYGHQEHTFLTRLLNVLGVRSGYQIANAPTQVETLYTAPDLFSEVHRGRAAPAHAAWLRNRVSNLPPSLKGRKIFISRDRMSGLVGRHLCEDILERNLEQAGFDIVAPETFSLEDQLAIYANADVVIAADGSALHIVPFSVPETAQIIVLNRRPDVPELISNQLDSFTASRVHYVNVIDEIFWPTERADNVSLVQLDFDRLRARLTELGVIPEDTNWTLPTAQDFERSRGLGRGKHQGFLTDVERPHFIQTLRRSRAEARHTMKDTVDLDPIPAIDGLRYFRVLKRLHEKLNPDWYLEVGTFTGKSLALARCNTVSVDPEFKITYPVVNPAGKQMFFFQQTSDAFFSEGFLKKNKISVDFAFLDGMHLFEFLLRDFIAAEKVMAKGGVIALHDCCPTTEYMATREFHDGPWTGDVWKTLLILLRYRPDLQIDVTKAGDTGLVLVRNLNPKSQVLSKKYDALVKEYMHQTLSGQPGGIGGFYRNFDLVDPTELIHGM